MAPFCISLTRKLADFEVEQDEMSRANPPVDMTPELWVQGPSPFFSRGIELLTFLRSLLSFCWVRLTRRTTQKTKSLVTDLAAVLLHLVSTELPHQANMVHHLSKATEPLPLKAVMVDILPMDSPGLVVTRHNKVTEVPRNKEGIRPREDILHRHQDIRLGGIPWGRYIAR